MKNRRRDLLVMLKDGDQSQREIDNEVDKLHDLLYETESVEHFCIAHELIDLARYKIVHKAALIAKYFKPEKLKPFQFLFNRN